MRQVFSRIDRHDRRLNPERMRVCRAIFLLLLLGLASPMHVRAETTVYFVGRVMEVPPPVMLLVAGLALLTLGIWIRRWFRSAYGPEPEPDDVHQPVTGPLPEFSSAMRGLHVLEDRARQDRAEPLGPGA